MIVIFLPFVGHSHLKGVGPGYTAPLPLPPVSLWFLHFMSLVLRGENLLLVFQVILRDSYSISSCNFAVSIRGDRSRVFLLCHFGHPIKHFFLCLFPLLVKYPFKPFAHYFIVFAFLLLRF